MDEKVWHNTMKEYIKSYESIMHLLDKGIIDEDNYMTILERLIQDIIATFESEVEE